MDTGEFFKAHYPKEDLIDFKPFGVRRVGEADLSLATHFDPNPRAIGETPKRRYLITSNKFETHRRLSYLTALDYAPALAAVWLDAKTGKLVALWNVERISEARLQRFFVEAVRSGSEAGAGLTKYFAPIPGGLVDAKVNCAKTLNNFGIPTEKFLPTKNYVVWLANSH